MVRSDSSVTNEYYLVVDGDPAIRAEWAAAFEGTDIEAFITGSISDALVKWTAWFLNGCVPRSVIVDWNTRESTVTCRRRERGISYCHDDGVSRKGAQYLLHYCIGLSPEGIFVVYTNNPTGVTHIISQDPVVSPHVVIAHKNKYMTKQVLDRIRENPVFIEQTSGFYNIETRHRG